jgi:hypothetical protein
VNISGSVDVVTVNTSAHIGRSAKVNCGTTCADNVASPNAEQSVRVAAGNNYYALGIAATLAIGGTAGVGVGVGVHIVSLNTDAYIDDGAYVNAARTSLSPRQRRIRSSPWSPARAVGRSASPAPSR